MIALRFVDGLACPVAVCDVCGEEINAANSPGMVAWDMATEPDGRGDGLWSSGRLVMAHKAIGGRSCLNTFEASVGQLGTDELAAFLYDLAHNVERDALHGYIGDGDDD